MNRISIILLSMLCILIPRGNCQDCTSADHLFSFMFQSKKYEIVKEMYSWNIASQCAVDRGGYLVQINSKAEQDTIYQSIVKGAKISSTYRAVSDGGGASYVWIGANDKATEGTWIWDGNDDGTGTHFWSGQGLAGTGTGTAVDGLYNNWGGASANPTNMNRRNEPDNYAGNQDAAAMALGVWPVSTGSLGVAGEWNDIGISATLYFVVEYDSSSATNPEKLHTQVTIFPSPATDHITITSSGSLNPLVEVRIFNILGAEIFKKTGIRTFELPVNLSEYQAGVYFVYTELEQGQVTRRKIIVR